MLLRVYLNKNLNFIKADVKLKTIVTHNVTILESVLEHSLHNIIECYITE